MPEIADVVWYVESLNAALMQGGHATLSMKQLAAMSALDLIVKLCPTQVEFVYNNPELKHVVTFEA